MPSTPRWKRTSSAGIHATSVSGEADAAQPDSARITALTATPNGTATRSPAGPGSSSSASAPASGTASSDGQQDRGHVTTTTPATSSSTPASSAVR